MPPVDNRRYPKRPLVGVGAIILRRDRILMAQRGKEPLKGWWSLPGGALETGETLEAALSRQVREETAPEAQAPGPPGGALEPGETLEAALRREVREETGLEIEPLGVFEIFERIIRDATGVPEYHYVLMDYICRVIGGTLRAGDDVCQVAWCKPRSEEHTAE